MKKLAESIKKLLLLQIRRISLKTNLKPQKDTQSLLGCKDQDISQGSINRTVEISSSKSQFAVNNASLNTKHQRSRVILTYLGQDERENDSNNLKANTKARRHFLSAVLIFIQITQEFDFCRQVSHRI
jgi:hypothetical protein